MKESDEKSNILQLSVEQEVKKNSPRDCLEGIPFHFSDISFHLLCLWDVGGETG